MSDTFNSNFLHLNLTSTSSSSSAFSVSTDPIIFFTILDHYLRRDIKDPVAVQQQEDALEQDENSDYVIGVLLGVRSEDGTDVEIKNCFPLAEDTPGYVDTEYLAQMYSLHQRVNNKEVIVGWYITGSDIDGNALRIHEYFESEMLPHKPLLLLVDTSLSNDKMGIKSYISAPVGVVGSTETPGSMFVQIPCEVKYFDAERTGLDIISLAKETPDSQTSLLSDMDNLERSVKQVFDMLETVSNYVNKVLDGQEPANNSIGRYLMDTITSIPRIDVNEFDKMFNSHLQDLLMVVYLANLTRTQLAIAERLQNFM